MNPGLLNKKIKLYKITIGLDYNGFETKIEEYLFDTYASVRSLSNREVFSNSTNLITEDILIAKVRYRNNINNLCIVEFEGQKYNVISIDLYDFKKDYMQLRIQKVKQGG